MKISSFLLLFLVEVCSQQTYPYVFFMEQTLANHSYVDITTVGGITNKVQCITDLSTCCSGSQGVHRGDWYFPNGNRLPFSGANITLYRSNQRVELRRFNNANSPTGIYRCDIQTDDDNITERETVYVGLYNSSGGDVTILGGVTYDSDQMTLTCISTGGPATTVTWTRDSTTITGGQTVLNNPVTANYTHTLTISTGGEYSCNISNNKPSFYLASITIPEAVQMVGPTSINVSWTPSTGATGYRINYVSSGGDSDSVTVSGGSTSSQTLTGLTNGLNYTISVIATSNSSINRSIVTTSISLVPGQPTLSVRYGINGTVNSEQILSVSTTTVTIPDLNSSTTYSIEVAAVVNNSLVGEYSDPQHQLTNVSVPLITIDNVTATSISISWTSGGTESVTYEVEWQRDSTRKCSYEDRRSETITDGSTHFVIIGVEEYSWYAVVVTTSNRAGFRNTSIPVVTLESAPSAPPSHVIITNVGFTTLTVQWGMVPCIHQNGNITGYSVRYRVKEDSSEVSLTQSVREHNVSQTNITNLTTATVYSIQVAAVTGTSNIGVYSIAVDVETRDLLPPTDVTVVQVGPTSVSVTWTPPSTLGYTTGYRISYTAVGTDISESDDVSRGTINTYTLTGLQTGLTYSISVASTAQGFIRDSMSVEIILIPEPSEVSVNVVSITVTSISLSWSVASVSVSSWEVVWRETDRGTESSSGSLSGTSYTIDQLDSTTIYTVRVSATNVAGTTFSNTLFISTASDVCDLESIDSTFTSCEKDNTVAIIGGVVTIVLGLILAVTVIVVVILVLKHRNRGNLTPSFKETRDLVDVPISTNQFLELSKVTKPTLVDPDELQSCYNRTGDAGLETEETEVEGDYETLESPPLSVSSDAVNTVFVD